MATSAAPEGYRTVTPYLIINNASRLIDFMKAAFGAVEVDRQVVPGGRIVHAQVRVGDSMIMMGEAAEGFAAAAASLYLYVPDADAAYRAALAAGAVSLMEPADQVYGDRCGGVQDPEGIRWWIATHVEDVGPAELARRAAVR